jgi:hypothetical protein
MSVKLNNITTDGSPISFNEVFAPTPDSTSNTTVLATNTWIKTYLQTTIGLISKAGLYASAFIVTAQKTIPEIIVNCSSVLGITGNTILGGITANQVNIANGATSGSQLIYLGQAQTQIVPNATNNTYSIYLVSNKASTSKIQNGTISATNTGTTVTFNRPFSVGCVPIVVATITNSISGIASVFQPTGVLPNEGVGILCNNGTKNCAYIAVGF